MTYAEIITSRKTVGALLKKEREAQGVTVHAIMVRSGLQRKQIVGIENGSNACSFDSYLRIMSALNCSFVMVDERGGNSGLIQVGLEDSLTAL